MVAFHGASRTIYLFLLAGLDCYHHSAEEEAGHEVE